jgi:glycosyltransferase involved in cell wall biosynthesis
VGVSFQPVERKLGVRAKQQKGTLGVPYEKIVLFVGRLCAEKNLKLWLDVARIILRHDRSVGFVIVGDGPLRRILEQTSVSLNIQSNVTFVGAIPYEQISQFYSIADVFLLTSKTEGLGRVLIEAGLGGVPAVATRCGGPEDLVVDGITGFLCREGHADELAQRCLDLLKDPQLAHQMGQGAKQHLSNSYSVENTGKQLVSLWRSTGRFQQSD